VAEIILHHYPLSPYAEKIRLALGLKGLTWRSVLVPVVMPKPDLVALTGGYRRTPVLQIGADIYCDTLCIARELQRRVPEPTLYPGTDRGTAEALAWWAEKSMFNTAVGLAFGEMGEENLPDGFLADRGAASGREISAAKLRSARPILVDTLRAQFSLLEAMLEARPFLLGDRPGIADFAAYHSLWFIEKNCDARSSPLAEFPHTVEWMSRIRMIGHGKSVPMTSVEAIEVAKASTPSTQPAPDPHDPAGRRPGQRVRVTPDDFARVPVTGELVRSDAYEIVIRRTDERAGEVLVHFPRAGFVVSPAKD
jgi:glutathione S-transferase